MCIWDLLSGFGFLSLFLFLLLSLSLSFFNSFSFSPSLFLSFSLALSLSSLSSALSLFLSLSWDLYDFHFSFQVIIKDIGSTFVTAESFLDAVQFSVKKNESAHGGFDKWADSSIVLGNAREPISGVRKEEQEEARRTKRTRSKKRRKREGMDPFCDDVMMTSLCRFFHFTSTITIGLLRDTKWNRFLDGKGEGEILYDRYFFFKNMTVTFHSAWGLIFESSFGFFGFFYFSLLTS